MEFTVNFWNKIDFLPSRRHRRLRSSYKEGQASVTIKEPSGEEFPVAFVVKKQGWLYEENENNDWGEITKELRTYGGRLYEAVYYRSKVWGTTGWLPLDYIPNLVGLNDFPEESEPFTDTAIIIADDTEEKTGRIRKNAEDYIIYDGKVWEACEEPMYVVVTFGLGHNHGGTGMFIQQEYNHNISKDCYFNAFERDKAVAYAIQTALSRGDTDSVKDMDDGLDIEVLMPEMVKRNPQKEHGDGDPFMNKLESLVQKSGSQTEAALLTIFATAKEISR